MRATDAGLKSRNDEYKARTEAATDAVAEYVLQDGDRRRALLAAVREVPTGLPGVSRGGVIRQCVLGMGLMGLPAVDWGRFAKRVLSTLGESGDGYRVRCHVVALEEPQDGCYRAQGDHGQAWDGDWERTAPELPWWWSKSPVVVLEAYCAAPRGGRDYAAVRRPGRDAVVTVAVGGE